MRLLGTSRQRDCLRVRHVAQEVEEELAPGVQSAARHAPVRAVAALCPRHAAGVAAACERAKVRVVLRCRHVMHGEIVHFFAAAPGAWRGE